MKHLLLSLLLLSGAVRLSAQTPEPLKIVVGSADAATGDTVCLPLTTINFSNIIAFQFPITWDASQLQFVGVQDFGVPGMDNEDFGFNPNVPNVFAAAWADKFANVVSLLDGDSLFTVCFKVLAPANTTCPITAGNTLGPTAPIGIFTLNNQGGELNIYNSETVAPGYVYVEGTSANQEALTSAPRLFPNPTSGPLTLTNLPDNTWQYQLSDATGRVVLTGSLTSNSLDLSEQQPGLYLLSLRSEATQLRPVPVVVSR